MTSTVSDSEAHPQPFQGGQRDANRQMPQAYSPQRGSVQCGGWAVHLPVDTNDQFNDQGGQYGMRITETSDSLGKYRYLLFVIRKGTPDN